MPELPEVETIRRGLDATVVGATIAEVEVFRDRSVRRQLGGEAAFAAALRGRRLARTGRRGKYLWFELHDDGGPVGGSGSPVGTQADPEGPLAAQALQVHLGMSGQLLVRERDLDHPHLRVRLWLTPDDSASLPGDSAYLSGDSACLPGDSARLPGDNPPGESPPGDDPTWDSPPGDDPTWDSPPGDDPTWDSLPPRYLDFVDQRTFGHMAVVALAADGEQLIPATITHVGRDPLEADFDLLATEAAIRRRRTGIKRALLDQSLVSGIGNIYADEALWRAGLHFARATDRLRPVQVRRLLESAADVLTESIAQGGTSFDELYVNASGEPGYFARSLAVYGREGEPCLRCGTAIARAHFMNRSSFYCPACQSTPRGPNARW